MSWNAEQEILRNRMGHDHRRRETTGLHCAEGGPKSRLRPGSANAFPEQLRALVREQPARWTIGALRWRRKFPGLRQFLRLKVRQKSVIPRYGSAGCQAGRDHA